MEAGGFRQYVEGGVLLFLAWAQFGRDASDLWAGMDLLQVMDGLRGPVELPAAPKV